MISRFVYRTKWFVTGLLLLWGCENMIEYSPYQTGNESDEDKMNLKAISDILHQSNDTFQSFRIALIGDSHTYYDDFEDQIAALNANDSIDFVVHNGDVTLSGIYREFLWFRDIAKNLKHPMITLIGNHDFLSNGDIQYQSMFGPLNFTMDYNNCRFVFFDDIIWERNVQDPDFAWLENACVIGDEVEHIFVFAHIPPWSDPFSIGNRYLFYQILEDQNVSLSVHGHNHTFFHGYRENCDVPFLLTGDSEDREIILLYIHSDTLTITRQPI